MKETSTYKQSKDKAKNNTPQYIIVHHSGGTDTFPLADTSHHTAEQMESWHLTKGWDGLGYHYVIHKDGEIWAGRPEHRSGAHAQGYNSKSIGICLSGNFDATMPTEAQTKALRSLLLGLKAKYYIPIANIIPHRNVAKKTCYGKNLLEDWARKLVSDEADTICKKLSEYSKEEIVAELLRRIK